MPTLENSLRAPAECPKTGLGRVLGTALTWLLWPVIRCSHRNTTLPYNDHQTCLDCGSSRLYLFHTDFEHADAGIFIGKWKKAVQPQSAHRVIARTLIANATAPVNGRAAILNPGSDSPLFQRRGLTAPASFERVFEASNQIVDRHVSAAFLNADDFPEPHMTSEPAVRA